MLVDKTTLSDLAIFHAEEEQSIFNLFNHTVTNEGRYWLKHLLAHPHGNLQAILDTQATIRVIAERHAQWPTAISNGTIMVIEKIYESQIDALPKRATLFDTWNYKLLHSVDYSLVMYTVEHAYDFFKGIAEVVVLMHQTEAPRMLAKILQRMKALLQSEHIHRLLSEPSKENISATRKLQYGHFLLNQYKSSVEELIGLYGQLDAYYALATATIQLNLQFPKFLDTENPCISAEQLYHILLKNPSPYDLEMGQHTNFIFLTGANMAGKSTFIKAVGLAVYLAHLGMAVPAQNMRLSLFDGLLSNIQVVDNILKGESYFFNEVQRIKTTIVKVMDGKKWLVLIDELFKGTNTQDALRCTATVIKGLLKLQNTLIILSTHLYETGNELSDCPNIAFRYFETGVEEDQLTFSYRLLDGISNDRLGYLILKQEGVVQLLDGL
ncbi:MAG: DNA mismatch repair protein MutS [Bacteroidetes bacterium]|nr:MAG: DNA mismatch repair protein MutS [Bacteroidota bacterium]